MADANQVQVSYTRETTWGTTPANAFNAFPITGGSMAFGIETVRSQTVRSDAQLADSKKVGEAPTASYDFELAAQIYDDFMRSAVRSDADWSTAVAISGTDIAATNSQTFTSTSTDFTAENIAVGQWVYVAGFSNAANNGWFKVTTIATNTLTVSNGTPTTESAGATITMEGSYVWSGSTEHSYSLQEQFQDLTNRYHVMTGSRLNSFGLTQTPGGIITGAISFDGKGRAQASSKAGDGTVNAAASEDVSSEVDGFSAMWIGGSAVSYDIMELSFNISIPNRPAKGLGNAQRTRMPQGSPEVTGSFSVYLDDTTWALDTNWESFTKQALAFSIDLQNDDRFLIEMPQVVFTSEPGTNPGLDGDVMLTFDFAAEPGGSHGGSAAEKTVVITRTQT